MVSSKYLKYNKAVFVSFLKRHDTQINSRQTHSWCPWWHR